MKIRACVVLGLGMLGLVIAGCDDSDGQATLTSRASSINTGAIVSPTPIVLAPLGAGLCAGGVAFNSSFNLTITAGVHDATLDSVTLQLLDGTNLGGPSVTIPRPELTSQAGTALIRAGTTRDFALHPAFPCIVNTPQSLRASAVLLDSRGVTQTIVVAGRTAQRR